MVKSPEMGGPFNIALAWAIDWEIAYTYIIHTYIHTYIHTCEQKGMHTYIHTYIFIYIVKSIYIYIYIYVHMLSLWLPLRLFWGLGLSLHQLWVPFGVFAFYWASSVSSHEVCSKMMLVFRANVPQVPRAAHSNKLPGPQTQLIQPKCHRTPVTGAAF